MAPFHAALSRPPGHPLPGPPAHVTLYTQRFSKVISLPADADLRAMTARSVAIHELPIA